MVLRQRIKNIVDIKTVKVLDAFPKVEKVCQEGSPISGAGRFTSVTLHTYIPNPLQFYKWAQLQMSFYFAVSLLSYLIILWLIIVETSYYFHSNIVYKFLPDTDFDAKLKFNVDITVHMPCHSKYFQPFFGSESTQSSLRHTSTPTISTLNRIQT